MEEMIGSSKRTQQPADTFGEQKRDINVETRDCHLVDLLVWWSCSSSRVQRCHRIHSKWAKCYVKTTAMTCAHFPIHVYSERGRVGVYKEGPCNFNINSNNIGHHMSPAVATARCSGTGNNFPKRHFEIIRFDSFSKSSWHDTIS